MCDLVRRAEALRAELNGLIEDDAAAYALVMAACQLPRATDAEEAARQEAIQAALRHASQVPLQVADRCVMCKGSTFKSRKQKAEGRRQSNDPHCLLPSAYCLLIVGLAVCLTGCGPSHVVVDNEQGRLDQAALLLQGEHTVGQTFVSHFPRLTAVEILLVVYEPQADRPQALVFHLRASPQSNVDLATIHLDSQRLRHNDPQRFTFPPIQDSAGRSFYFFLEGSDGNRVTAWSNSVDVYGEGAMWVNGQEQPGDLQFKTFYDEDVALIVSDLGHGMARGGWLLLPIFALFLMPGYLVLAVLRPSHPPSPSTTGRGGEGVGWEDPAGRLALAAGLSLALIPVALLATTLVGWRWNGPRVTVTVVALALAGAWLAWRRREDDKVTRRQGDKVTDNHPVTVSPCYRATVSSSLCLLVIFTVSLALRFLQVRELALPAWVDSVHHAAMAKLIADAGAVPPTYAPLGPDTPFLYHFGFHALVASFAWLTGLDVARAELVVGQMVNGWTVLAMFLLAARLTASPLHSPAPSPPTPPLPRARGGVREAGLVAALVAGTVSWMPSYYVTWGRYTQLAGLAILPAAITLTLDALEAHPVNGGGRRGTGRAVLLAGIAAAGLLLTHYRVMLIFVAWVVAHLALASVSFSTADRRLPTAVGRWSSVVKLWVRAAAVGLAGGLIAAPWLARLGLGLIPTGVLGTWLQGADSFNAVPRALIDLPRNQLLLALAGLGWVLSALARQRLAWLVLVWVAIVLLITNPGAVGLASTWVISNASLVISLFVPVSLLIGAGVALVAGWIDGRLPERTRPAGRVVAHLALVGLALGSGWDLIHVVNPVTVLATRDDVAAMAWVRDHLPADARFLINTRYWQAGTYVGADGGYWLPLLAGRETIMPSVLYVFGSRQQVEQVTADARAVENAASLDDPGLLGVIAAHRLTHIYLGAKGGKLTPQVLLKDPRARPVYSNGAVWVFELVR